MAKYWNSLIAIGKRVGDYVLQGHEAAFRCQPLKAIISQVLAGDPYNAVILGLVERHGLVVGRGKLRLQRAA